MDIRCHQLNQALNDLKNANQALEDFESKHKDLPNMKQEIDALKPQLL